MRRYYFISDELDDLSVIERELEGQGMTRPQIHVLSLDDDGLAHHHLNDVAPLLRKDVIRATAVAGVFGFLSAVLVMAFAVFSGVTASIGWSPFVLLAFVVMGLITWEGGMWGIQQPNSRFRRFQAALAEGKHILYVDVTADQRSILMGVIERHAGLKSAGSEESPNGLLISAENGVQRFAKWAP